jgi:serine/threonine protein kinase
MEFKTINIVFPYAQMDMETWMSLDGTPFEFTEKSRRVDLYQSTYDLVSALAFLHRENIDGFSTTHHDLKPKNILVFGRKWKIADFGRARLRYSVRDSETEGNDGLGSYDYHPPEYYNDDGSRASRTHGRSFDIWAMGCIMLQVALLVVYGWESGMVENFRSSRCSLVSNQRRFSKRDGEDSSFHNSLAKVDSWIFQLMGDGSKMLQQFLEIIIQMLRGDPKDRLASWEVELDLYEMLHSDHSIAQRLEMNKARIPSRPKSASAPTGCRHLYRAAMRNDAVRAVCLLEAGWHLELPNAENTTALPVPNTTLWKELRKVHRDLGPIAISEFCGKVLQQPAIHTIECHGFQLAPKGEPPLRLATLRESSSTGTEIREDLRQSFRLTLIRQAIMHRSYETLRSHLIQLPKDMVGWKDKFGKTPLHYAAEHSEEIITRLILQECPVPETLVLQESQVGQTPIHIAAANGHYGTTLLLLNHVEDQAAAIALEDAVRDTPITLARKSGNNDLRCYLEDVVTQKSSRRTGPLN